MSITTIQGEIRPSVTTGDPHDEPFVVPLLRLRRRQWRVIQPDECLLGEACPVCAWRTAGLLDRPNPRVVREPASGYLMCRSSYCPGCNVVACACPPDDYDEARAEHAYCLGHEHGTADGLRNRPTADWLAKADLDAESYWQGYDDACTGLPVGMPAESLPERPSAPVLWDECDDGLPF